MDWGRRLRRTLLRPLLAFLTRLDIDATHVTVASLCAGLAFVPLWLVGESNGALLALAAHVVLDGIDGPLSRHRGRASNRGSFTDTMCDQFVVAATTIVLMGTRVVSPVAGSVYVVTYTCVVLFAFLRNALSIPYSWLFRPRLLVYAWMAVDTWWLPGWLEAVLWVSSGLLAAKVASGYLRIRRRLPNTG